MQIHISWKALLAGLIFVIAAGLLIRTSMMLVRGEEQAGALPSATAVAGGQVETATAEGPTAPLATVTLAATATGTATVVPPTATNTASPAPSPTPTVAPASPTPFQPPTRVPTPVPQQVVIIAQGFGQSLTSMSYAFVVSNPNPDLLAQNIRYQVAAYDAQGIVLSTDTGTVPGVGPGQTMGVAQQLTLASNLVVARIEVLIRPGQFVQSPPLQQLAVTNGAFVPGTPPQLTGVVNNLFNRDLADLQVVGIAYDDAGIIGGGTAVVPFLPTGGQAAVSVPVVISGQEPTRIEFYIPVESAP